MPRRQCQARREDGRACAAPALAERGNCFWHDPEAADEAQQARRLGGRRRRKEAALAAAYEFDGLSTIPDIRRLLEIAVIDTLALDNSIARNRGLAYMARIAAETLQKLEVEERLRALEEFLQERTD